MLEATLMGARRTLPMMIFNTAGESGGSSEFDAMNGFLSQFTDEDPSLLSGDGGEGKKKKTPESQESKDDHEEDPREGEPEDDADEGDEGEEDDAEDEESEEKPSKRVVLDHDADAVVKVKVDGEIKEVKVSDLSRLYGQEASLTRKSTEAAEYRKAAEAERTKYVTGTAKLLERAMARFEPYSKIDWLGISKDPNVSAEEARALFQEAKTVQDDVRFLQAELDASVQELHQSRHQQLVEAGAKAWTELSDEKTGIKGWGKELYQNISSYAVGAGLPAQIVRELVDPAAIRLLHKAYLYDEAEKAKSGKSPTTRVKKSPNRIIKESSETSTKPIRTEGKVKAAEKRLTKTGSLDDAADLFFQREMSRSEE